MGRLALDASLEKLVIGTGFSGMMKVSERVLERCQNHGIEVEKCPTKFAAK